MHAIGMIRVEPFTSEGSQRENIQRAVDALRHEGLDARVGDLGTEVEGELPDILQAVRRIHESLHGFGAPRLSTHITVETRRDDAPHLDEARAKID